jgi:hypothetical protein
MNKKLSRATSSTVTLTKSSLLIAKDVLIITLTLLPLILGFFIFYGTSSYILKNGSVILSQVEYYMRCEINVAGKNLLPFLNMTRYLLSNTICWTNSIGLLRSLFSDNFLYGKTGLCASETNSVTDILKKGGDILTSFYNTISIWIVNNPFTNTLPIYNVLESLNIIGDTIRSLLDCLCGLLDPLWKFIAFRLKDSNLYCFIHQILNGVLGIVQIILTTTINIILDIITSVFFGTILDTLTNIWNLQVTFYPQMTNLFNKISASLAYLGNYITNIFVDFVCIIVSEAEQSSNGYDAVETRYQQCIQSSENINIGCIIGRLLNVGLKIIQAIVQILIGIFKYLDPTDNFRWNIWDPNIIWDSIRNPLNLTNFQYIDDDWIERDSESTIEIQVDTQNISSCKSSSLLIDSNFVCYECIQFSNTSLETCLCGVVKKLDDLLEPVINRRILKPFFCDGVFGIIRIIVSLFKLFTDIFRTLEITSTPKILDLLSNPITYDRIFNEIGGDQYNIGGFLYFLNLFVVELIPNHPDLECIPSLITYPLKAITELLRFLFHIFQNFVADIRLLISSEPNPFINSSFLISYLCVYPYGGERCFDSEIIFKWLKLPRNRNDFYKNQVDIITVNITQSNYRQGFLECACYVINLRFITSFSSDLPFLDGFDLPDICCPIYNISRVIIELIQLIFNMIISLFQTIFDAFRLPSLNNIFILRYLACLTNTTTDPCSNINSVLNDISDTVSCVCKFITDLLSIPEISQNISTDPLVCLCDFFNGFLVVVSNSVITLRNSAETIIGIFDCINTTSGNFEQSERCQDILPLKTIDIFKRVNVIIDGLGIILSKFTCLISNIFAYKCLNSPSKPLCLSIDFRGCVIKRGCESYSPIAIIGNNRPTEDELFNCVNQCGDDTCAYCILMINISLNLYNTSVIGCPNGCLIPDECTPSDKLSPLIDSLYLIISNIIKLIFSWVEQIFVYIIEKSTGNILVPNANLPTSLSEFLNQILTVLGTSLFGDTVHTWGPLQHLGDFLNCILGPPGCDGGFSAPPSDINSFFPTQDASVKCFGSVFILIGNIAGQLYGDVKDILVSFIGFIESILTGNTSMIGTFIKNFILAIFRLIGHLLKSIGLIAQFLLGLIAGVFNLIFPGSYDTIFTVLNTVFKPFLIVLQAIFDFLKAIGIFSDKKRFINVDYKFEILQFLDKWEEFNVLNNFDASKYDLYFLSSMIKKYQFYYNKTDIFFSDQKRTTNSNDFTKEFQSKYNLSDTELTIISNPSLLLPLIKNDTYCYKVIHNLKDLSYQNMNMFEELAFKTCYTLVIVPILNNNNQNSTLILPLDFFYNMETMITTLNDILSTSELKKKWDSPIYHTHDLLYTRQEYSFDYFKKRNFVDDPLLNILENTSQYKNLYDYIDDKTKENLNRNTILSYIKTINNSLILENNVDYVMEYVNGLSKFNLSTDFSYKYSWIPSQEFIKDFINKFANKTNEPKKRHNLFNSKDNNINLEIPNYAKLIPLFYKYKKYEYERKSLLSFKKSNAYKLYDNTKKFHSSRIHKFDPDLNQPPFFSFLYNYLHVTVPKTARYWYQQYNDRNNITIKRNIGNTNDSIKTNGVLFAIQNIFFDRILLISDVISTITHKEISNITSALISNANLDIIDNDTEIEKFNGKYLNENLHNKNKKRPSILERIVILHKKLKKIRKISIPDIPKSITRLIEFSTKKRSLIDINCDCNCTIVDEFVQELVDVVTYCYEKQFLGIKDPLNLTIQNTNLFAVTNYNPNKIYSFPENIIYPIIGIDIVSTITEFIFNTNTDILKGPVGLLYQVRRLPIPFASIPCSRINLTCQMGIGLGKGILISGLIVFIIGVVLYILVPPIAGILNTVVVGTIFGSLSIMFIALTLNISWGYQFNCYSPDENSILTLALPFLGYVKMISECAPDEIYNIITDFIITPCPLDSYSFFGFLNLLNSTGEPEVNPCPICPERLNFISCHDYGLESPFTVFGMFLLRYISPVGLFLQNSCLVRGNCFGFLLGESSNSLKNDGILGSLFTNFNSSEFIQKTNPILEQCFYFNSLSIVAGLIITIFGLILLVYSIILFFDILSWIISIINVFQTKELNEQDIQKVKKYFG